MRAGNFHFPGEESIINIFTHTHTLRLDGLWVFARYIGEGGRCGAGRETTDTNCPPHVRAFPPRIMIYKRRTGHPVPDNGTLGSRHSDNRLNWATRRLSQLNPKLPPGSAATFPKRLGRNPPLDFSTPPSPFSGAL